MSKIPKKVNSKENKPDLLNRQDVKMKPVNRTQSKLVPVPPFKRSKVNQEMKKYEKIDEKIATKPVPSCSSIKQPKIAPPTCITRLHSFLNKIGARQTQLQSTQYQIEKHDLTEKTSELPALTDDITDAQEKIFLYTSELGIYQKIIANMHKEQINLRNTIQELKGKIRVYCRIIPPLDSEISKPRFNINYINSSTMEVKEKEMSNSDLTFKFDRVFPPETTQENLFVEVANIVQSAVDGNNVFIFSYGQTGSGKTYTMEGGDKTERCGIIPRAFNMIFSCLEDLKQMGWKVTIKASFFDVYDEVIYDDLLKSSKDQKTHEIKMLNSEGTDLYVSNLTEKEVKDSIDVMWLMQLSQYNRKTAAATLNNERGSRSHSVVQIKISSIHEKRKEQYCSTMNLVEFAGSESDKTTRRVETSVLNKVILSLQSDQNQIPFNSSIPYTLVIVHIKQFEECFNESLNTLRFAT